MSAMKPDAVDQLHHDHVHLNRLVEGLRSSVQSCLRGEQDPADLQAEMREFVHVAQEELLEHFDTEETGLFPWITERFPDQSMIVAELEVAHDRLCGVMSRMARLVESAPEDFAHQLDATVALFARFDANYVKHARDERDLLQQLTSRLTPEMRREVDAMLAEL